VSRISSNHKIFLAGLLAAQPLFAADNNIQGHIGGLSQASQSVGNVPGNRANADLFFDYHKNNTTTYSKDLDRRFTMSALVNDQSLTMYSIQEAYIGGNITSKDSVKFGRQIIPWSSVDHTWGFGKLNNRKNFNSFEPGQEGLLGLMYERKSTNGMRYRAFVSGLYVPEMNPGLDINSKDKTITSRNPWATPPARTTVLEGRDVAIQYNVKQPNPSDVIYRYTVGGNIGWENKHWAFDNFFIRKPENQISTQVNVLYNTGDDVVKAFITPQFYYHDVYGSNLKYRNGDLEMYVSGIAIRPNTFPDGNRDATTYTEIKTEKRREDYMGGGISKINDLYGMGLNYVARLSPFNRERDSLAVDPRWNQALNIFLLRNFKRDYRVSADFKYDMLTTDRLAMLRFGYNATKSMTLNFGVNMIGTPTNGKSYWSPYTNNDAVYGGLRYIF